MRLERDGDLVAEAALHARAETTRRNQVAAAETPRPIAGDAAPGRVVAVEHAVAEQLQPQREQRVGQRGQQRQHERDEQQPRLVRGSRACTAATSTAAPAAGRRRGRASGEDVIARPPPRRSVDAEALRLQVEHRAVAAAPRHQLVVRAELDDAPVLEHADAVGVAHRREPVRDQDRRARRGSRRGCGRRSPPRRARRAGRSARRAAPRPAPEPHGAQRPGQRDALPLAAGEVGAAGVAAWRGSCRGRRRSVGARRRRARRSIVLVGRAARRDVVAQRQLEADEVLEHRGDPRRATRRRRGRAGRCRRPRWRRPAGRRAGTAAWRAWSCRRRSGRRWPATTRPGSSGRDRRAPARSVRG